MWDDGSQKDDTKQLQAIWSALCNGQPAPLLPHKHPRGLHGGVAEEEDPKLLAVMETARVEKHVKSRLAVAADHFNRDYKKGFQFLQVLNLCSWLLLVCIPTLSSFFLCPIFGLLLLDASLLGVCHAHLADGIEEEQDFH